MSIKMRNASIAFFSIVIGYTIWFLANGNSEFLLYSSTLIVLWSIIMITDKKMDYPISTLVMFIGWLMLHMWGGTIPVGDGNLYKAMLFDIVGDPYHILKYDQLIHFYCYIVMARLIYVPISHIAKENAPKAIVGLIVILAASGIGAVNEIIEFAAVVQGGPETAEAVGGYTNTALDICFNFVGACVGWWSLLWGKK